MGSREEFESIVPARGSGGGGGGEGGLQNFAYKKDKNEQASVEEVLSAAEQYALRFL